VALPADEPDAQAENPAEGPEEGPPDPEKTIN